jgi:hypothetical protein
MIKNMHMNKFPSFKLATFCLLLLLNYFDIKAQVNNDQQIAVLKNVIPPSPNSSSIGKYGEWPVSLYTGVPSISVPLCELKGRTISVPVSLSYHASGNKVGDIPSWVGLGWSLNAGGAVTRSVRGLPDEYGYFDNTTNYTNPNDFSSAPISQTMLALTIVGSAKNSTDTQEDIYSFNALGKSYKFILKADGSIQTIPASLVKLVANPIAGANHTANTWVILLEDGSKLLFGGNNYIETTANPRSPNGDGQGITFTSSWMLQSITTPANEVVSFSYSPSSLNQDSYYSESDFIEYKTGTNAGGASTCANVSESSTTKATIEKQTVLSLNPATIETELGRIEFIANETDRQDLPGAKTLQEIKVFSKLVNKYIEDYILTTSYSTAITSNVLTTPATVNDTYINYRLRLNYVEKKILTNPASASEKWTFDYNSQNLPARRSFAQDHWGFFNGATSNTTLLPEVYFVMPSSAWVISQAGMNQVNYGFMPSVHNIGANRESNATYLQAEMLTAIHYPTGGYSNFTYEPNSIPVSEETFTNTNLNLALNMYVGQSPATNVATTTFTITKPQYINLSASSYISPAIYNDHPSASTTTEILDQSGTRICSFTNSNNKWYNLIAAGTYTLKISSNVLPEDITGTNTVNVSATLQFYQSNGIQSYNKLVGGLRINRIADYDNVYATSINERSFIYESPLEINPISIQDDYLTTQQKVQDTYNGEICYFTTVTRNSSSRFALGSIQGGTVAYGKVTTLAGSNGANGKIVSLFSNEADAGVAAAKTFPYPSTDSRDHRRGLLLEETVYKSDLTTILKKTTHSYSFTSRGYITGFKAGYLTNWMTTSNACLYNIQGSCGITTVFTTTTSEQVKHFSQTDMTYDNTGANPLSVITNYFYDNSNNLSPTRIETTDSKGNTIKSYSRTALEKSDINAAMPLTAAASAAIDEMLARNILSPLIEHEVYNSDVLQSRSLTNYKNWTATVLQPENVELQIKNNPRETRVEFTKYDDFGNLLEQKKSNNTLHSYLWDYQNNYAIAECTNADNTNIAYTSFEADGKGNWNYPGATTTDPVAITGKKDYNLGGGDIARSGLSTTSTYVVSYWSKNGAQNVNGSSSTTGRTINGWTYYEHKVVNPSGGTITISGTALIDELRLFPQNALMTTYTYDPLIGISSQCDANNRISYYEYDGLNRLVLIRDQDRNVIKKICYNYAGQPENCSAYGNVQKSGNFTRNNCSAGGTGSSVTYTVSANAYFSFVTQADADAKAQSDVDNNGQAYANSNGTCTFYNVQKSGNFTRNNCSSGGTPSTVIYTVAAGTYSSTISQAAADQLAQNDVNANGQTYANNNGTCTWYSVVKSGNFTRNNCATGGTGSTVTYTVAAGTYSSTTSQAAADQLAQNDVNNNGQTYANNNGTCTWYNVVKSGNFTRNNCSSGYVGSTVTYTVPANTYSSTTSQAAADQLAQNDVNSNGQAYANANGTCTQSSVTITSINYVGTSGFSAVFTNTSTGQQYSFSIPSSGSQQTLGTVAPATYNVTISKSGNNTSRGFYLGSYYHYGTSATFSNVAVSSSNNNAITIDYD